MSFSEKIASVSDSLIGRDCSAIILAGGSGSRFSDKCDTPKQLSKICGIPMILYSVKAFSRCRSVREIIIVSREQDIGHVKELVDTVDLKVPVKIVKGGENRQESALNGFEATSDKASLIAIHDAARPLIVKEDIERIIRKAARFGGAIAATAAVDTPKIVSGKGRISEKAPDRAALWVAQTPQIFKRDIYMTAAYYAREQKFIATDDASLLEFAGLEVYAVQTREPNFKVTFESDLLLAEAIINSRKKKEDVK